MCHLLDSEAAGDRKLLINIVCFSRQTRIGVIMSILGNSNEIETITDACASHFPFLCLCNLINAKKEKRKKDLQLRE